MIIKICAVFRDLWLEIKTTYHNLLAVRTCIDLMAIYERTCSSARTFFSSMTGRLAGKQQFRAFLNRELARVQETICFFLRKEPA